MADSTLRLIILIVYR